jgi:hypothetical protein
MSSNEAVRLTKTNTKEPVRRSRGRTVLAGLMAAGALSTLAGCASGENTNQISAATTAPADPSTPHPETSTPAVVSASPSETQTAAPAEQLTRAAGTATYELADTIIGIPVSMPGAEVALQRAGDDGSSILFTTLDVSSEGGSTTQYNFQTQIRDIDEKAAPGNIIGVTVSAISGEHQYMFTATHGPDGQSWEVEVQVDQDKGYGDTTGTSAAFEGYAPLSTAEQQNAAFAQAASVAAAAEQGRQLPENLHVPA